SGTSRRRGPARSRVGQRDVLRRRADLTFFFQRLQILANRARAELRVAPVDPFLAWNTPTAVGVGLHDACVDREPFASNQSFGHASPYNRLEDMSEDIALAETAVPVLREARMIRNLVFKAQPAEPPICQIQMNFIAQPSF